MFLTERIKEQIKKHSLEQNPFEACGMVVFNGTELLAIPCRNVAQEKNHNFTIGAQDYLYAVMMGEPVAYFHSHTSEYTDFSEKDKANALGHNLWAIMYHVPSDVFSTINPKNSPSYVGRAFKIGESDCYSLLQDYYKKELNVNLGNYFRDENWAEKTPEIYLQNYEKENFIKIYDARPLLENLERHDCLLFQFLPIDFPSHAGVYLGNGLFLHHQRNAYSVIERLTLSYLNRTMCVLRHKSLCKN